MSLIAKSTGQWVHAKCLGAERANMVTCARCRKDVPISPEPVKIEVMGYLRPVCIDCVPKKPKKGGKKEPCNYDV